MRYFHKNSEVFGVEKKQEHIIQDDWIEITKDEALKILNPPLDAAELKAQTLVQINNDYENEIAQLTIGIPATERETWIKQEQEARAYTIDSNTPTPFLDSLASQRGVPKDYLVSKIIEKADLFAVAVGALTGARQKAEDELTRSSNL